MVTLDLINTVAFGGAVLFVGHGVRSVIPVLARYNVPAPVIGGLLVALIVLVARRRGVELVAFDTRLQVPFVRNLDDATGMIGLSQRTIDDLGNVALSLFLVLALMTLRLWELAGLALPMVAILAVQVALIAAVCFWPLFRLMGRDYDAAVMAGGLCGFMLGTTANAMANMEALVDRYGPAPRAFLVVPMVGAFFIDFANAVIITLCVNLWT